MPNIVFFAAVGAWVLTVCLTASAAQPDQLIVHARILSGGQTVDADAVAIVGSRIESVGRSKELAPACTGKCRLIDAGGRFLMPGFNDGHVHLIHAGALARDLSPSGMGPGNIERRIRDFAAAHPRDEAPWITGHGWSLAVLRDMFPRRRELDRLGIERPIFLRSLDFAVVNTLALRAAGITKSTPNPKGGSIERGPDGEATGVLRGKAVQLVARAVPGDGDAQVRKAILRSQGPSLAAGFTSMQGGPVPLSVMKAYQNLDQAGLLVQRAFLWADLLASAPEFDRLVEFARSLPPHGKVRVSAFKGFLDGMVVTHRAALLRPYSDLPGNGGAVRVTQSRLNEAVLRANTAGFPVALHAAGDRAVRMALDAFQLSKESLRHRLLNRVEHIEVLDPADAARFATLGVIMSVQPCYNFESARRSLGTVRYERSRPWQALADQGALLVFGTGFPELTKHEEPIAHMACATSRTAASAQTKREPGVVDIATAVKAFTIGPAIAVSREADLGRVEPGYEADLVVYAKDPRESLGEGLKSDPPTLVMVAGKIWEGPSP